MYLVIHYEEFEKMAREGLCVLHAGTTGQKAQARLLSPSDRGDGSELHPSSPLAMTAQTFEALYRELEVALDYCVRIQTMKQQIAESSRKDIVGSTATRSLCLLHHD